MKFLLLCILALGTEAVLAANAPTKINLIPLESQFITVNSKDQAVVIKNINNALKQMSGGILDLPASIGLIVPQTYDSPFFDPMALTLVAPFHMVIDGKSKNPVFTRGVELHEFGHAIFNENMELILKKDPSLLKRWTSAKKIITKTYVNKTKLLKKQMLTELLQRKIEETKASATSPISRSLDDLELTLQDEEALLMSTYQSNEATLNAMGELFEALTPYNEFFADVVAVVIMEDPQTVANALHFSNFNEISYSDRSFRRRASRRKLSLEAHDFYSLSRDYIYKYYLSNPVYKSKGKAWLIRKSMDAVSCGIHSQNDLIKKISADLEVIVKKNPKFNQERYVLEKMNDGLDVCMDKAFL